MVVKSDVAPREILQQSQKVSCLEDSEIELENAQLQSVGHRTNRSDCSDNELLLAFRDSGDQGAFTELTERYDRQLLSYLRGRLGNQMAAEDVLQDTWIQVIRKADTFNEANRLSPWLYAIATNKSIDFQRRGKRHAMPSLEQLDSEKSAFEPTSHPDRIGRRERFEMPVESAIRQEEGARIATALTTLTEPQQQVVDKVYFRGMKYREAADSLSIPVGTVKSRLHAVIGMLKEVLNPDSPAAAQSDKTQAA